MNMLNEKGIYKTNKKFVEKKFKAYKVSSSVQVPMKSGIFPVKGLSNAHLNIEKSSHVHEDKTIKHIG